MKNLDGLKCLLCALRVQPGMEGDQEGGWTAEGCGGGDSSLLTIALSYKHLLCTYEFWLLFGFPLSFADCKI